MKPIDDVPMPPAPEGVDTEYLTRDIVTALDRAVLAMVERTALDYRCGRRAAATIVLRRLEVVR